MHMLLSKNSAFLLKTFSKCKLNRTNFQNLINLLQKTRGQIFWSENLSLEATLVADCHEVDITSNLLQIVAALICIMPTHKLFTWKCGI